MKQPILKKTPFSGVYTTPDKRFRVERDSPSCFGWRIIENGKVILQAKTLAEARQLIGPEK